MASFLPIAACALMLVLLVIDYLQTLTIVRDPRWRELNPLLAFELRRHPARQELVVAGYFLAVAALVIGLTFFGLGWAIYITAPVQAWCVWRNWHIGIELAGGKR